MADQKITQLDALAATPDDADILAIVDDVAGTPITKKITVANLAAAGGGATTVYKATDETVNNSATLQDDDDITFSGAADGIYVIKGNLNFIGSNVADLKFKFSLPGTSKLHGEHSGNTLFIETTTVEFTNPAVGKTFHISGIIFMDGTGGTVTLQWAQITAEATDTKMLIGTWLSYEKLN